MTSSEAKQAIRDLTDEGWVRTRHFDGWRWTDPLTGLSYPIETAIDLQAARPSKEELAPPRCRAKEIDKAAASDGAGEGDPAKQKAILVLKTGEHIEVAVERAHDAGVLCYVTNFGARVRAFRYSGVAQLEFVECEVVFVPGRDERLEGQS